MQIANQSGASDDDAADERIQVARRVFYSHNQRRANNLHISQFTLTSKVLGVRIAFYGRQSTARRIRVFNVVVRHTHSKTRS